MAKQVRPSIIALLASVSLVLFAVFGGVAALPDGVTVSDEATPSDDDLTLLEPRPGYDPSGTARVPLGNCASVIDCYVPNPPYFDADLESDALKSDAVRERADAREKQRARDEAEYAAFIEERLRRLSRK